jgi:hypothetical protein
MWYYDKAFESSGNDFMNMCGLMIQLNRMDGPHSDWTIGRVVDRNPSGRFLQLEGLHYLVEGPAFSVEAFCQLKEVAGGSGVARTDQA